MFLPLFKFAFFKFAFFNFFFPFCLVLRGHDFTIFFCIVSLDEIYNLDKFLKCFCSSMVFPWLLLTFLISPLISHRMEKVNVTGHHQYQKRNSFVRAPFAVQFQSSKTGQVTGQDFTNPLTSSRHQGLI